MISVTKEFTFDAAHRLGDGYKGKCTNLHGHTYKLLVTFALNIAKDSLDDVGMVVDFSKIKKIWKDKIEPLFDHADLNKALGFQTTAENMSVFLFNEFSHRMYELQGKNSIALVSKIRLYETPTSYCEYEPYNYIATIAADPFIFQELLSKQNSEIYRKLSEKMTPALKKIFDERKKETEKLVKEAMKIQEEKQKKEEEEIQKKLKEKKVAQIDQSISNSPITNRK